MEATKDQKQYIYKLCDYNKDLKEELVQWITGDVSKTSTNTLTFEQANKIIENRGGTPSRGSNWGMFSKDNEQHRKILSLCQDYGWQTKHPVRGITIADIATLGNWLEKDYRCPVKKPLKKMNQEELTKIINALTIMVRKKYK